MSQALHKKVTWQEVRDKVTKVNPEFAKLIDDIDPGEEFYLYLARYPFGSSILEGNQFYFPVEGKLISTSYHSFPECIANDIVYDKNYTATVPLSITLHNSSELFMMQENRSMPISILHKGKIFGLWGSINSSFSYTDPSVWNITAGCRNIFLMPKITDTVSFKKLIKARKLNLSKPRNLFEHGPLLSQIASHKDFTQKWHTEILVFPKKWLKEV